VPSLWDANRRDEILARVGSVTDASKQRWGRMTADRMLCHLTESFKMALGELPVVPLKLPVRYPLLKQLAIYLLPIPKGLPTMPELLAAPATPVADARADLQSAIRRFGERDRAKEWPEHAAFGRLSPNAWGVLMYRHCDHHLRQFGA